MNVAEGNKQESVLSPGYWCYYWQYSIVKVLLSVLTIVFKSIVNIPGKAVVKLYMLPSLLLALTVAVRSGFPEWVWVKPGH